LSRIWGNSPSNIWLAGGKTLWNFDGIVWKVDTIPVSTPLGSFFGIDGLTGDAAGNLYVTFLLDPVASESKRQYYFLNRNSDTWRILDSAKVEPGNVQFKWGYADLWTSPQGKMYSSEYGLYRWDNATWSKIFDSDRPLVRINGSGDDNIFIVGALGTVLHYNGLDWYQYEQFQSPNIIYTGVWTDGKEVFIAGHTYGGHKSIILHGR
jgi:hypothetical protein